MSEMQKLDTFVRRIERLGIKLEIVGNIPWIYINSVNGNRVRPEDYYYGNHGYTIGFLPIKPGKEFDFLDLPRTFKLIRKYL